jgi:hypothetical protein
MSGTNDFLPFANSGGANVTSQAAYVALTSLIANGFLSGVAPSAQFNKALRQSTAIAAALAQFIADTSLDNVLDDGNAANLLASLKKSAAALPDFTATLSASGVIKIPVMVAGVKRTVIIQWASGTQIGSTTGTQPTITFPIAFPNTCLFAAFSGRMTGATGILWGMNSQSSSTTSATGYVSSNGTTDQLIPQVLAIGW